MPMVANDGPHYGDNVKLAGPGKYTLKLSIEPPGASAHATSAATPTRRPASDRGSSRSRVEYDFTYAGIGKKGGY